jgi:hypothetical protein
MSMKHLIPLLAFSFLIGCDGEKGDVTTSERSPEEAASEAKPPKAVSVNPNLKYEIEGDAVTITGCDKKASGELIIAAIIEGKTVTSIGSQAFYYCSRLTSITIPDGVTSIGEGAFLDCTSLTTIEVGAENVNYADVNGVLFNKEKTVLHTYPAGKTGDNYVIANSVTSIGKGAFFGCSSLTSISIPDSVITIGGYAFNFCTSLTSITIPDGVTSIGEGAFSNCTSLTSITIPDGVTSIGNDAFALCTSLTSITIPDSVTSIGEVAFRFCTSLTSITIPDSVTSIGVAAFYYCTSLTAVTFLGDAPKIENDTFEESSPTIYRKPDAKGWGDTFAGRPVKLITEKP